MKKFYLSILILCIIFSQALSQWRIALSSTYPSGTTFQSLYFVNENVGWAVGSDGMILKTTNGGISWTQQTSNTTVTLYHIQAFDENNLIVSGGRRTLLRSSDGGNTWNVFTVEAIPETAAIIRKVIFFDQNIGYLLAYSSTTIGRIFKTTNGGSTWIQQYANTSNNLNDFDFANPNNGVAVGRSVGVLIYTTNGSTWSTAPAPSLGGFNYTRSDVRAVKMLDESTAVAVGWGSFAAGLQPSIHLRTTNGGATGPIRLRLSKTAVTKTFTIFGSKIKTMDLPLVELFEEVFSNELMTEV